MFVLRVMTHAEYDQNRWKQELCSILNIIRFPVNSRAPRLAATLAGRSCQARELIGIRIRYLMDGRGMSASDPGRLLGERSLGGGHSP